MKKEDLIGKLGVTSKAIEQHSDFNPLAIVISDWEGNELETTGFLKGDILGIKQLDKNYREVALDRVLEANVSFTSETNSLSELVARTMHVINPITKRRMEYCTSHGNSEAMTIVFRDKQSGHELSITLRHDAIHFKAAKK